MLKSCTGNFSITSTMWDCINGYIGVTPFTELQSPDDSDISVNVYVYGENMHYNRMTAYFLPQSRTITSSSCDITTESYDPANSEVTVLDLNPTNMNEEKLNEDFFGEQPLSLRSLLKRFWRSGYINTASNGTGLNTYSGNFVYFPTIQPTFAATYTGIADLWSYLRYAYLGMRGGLRKKFVIAKDANILNGLPTMVTLLPQNTTTTAAAMTYTATSIPDPTLDGTVLFVPTTNAGIEIELPFYNNNLFVWSSVLDPFNTSVTPNQPLALRNYKIDICATGGAAGCTIKEWTATAEDFMFVRWIAAPPYVAATVG